MMDMQERPAEAPHPDRTARPRDASVSEAALAITDFNKYSIIFVFLVQRNISI